MPGAAATEIELAKRVKDFSFKETGYLVFPSFFLKGYESAFVGIHFIQYLDVLFFLF